MENWNIVSLDFIYDLKDKLEESGYDYFIVSIKKADSNTHDRSNVFYRLSDKDSVESLKNVLDRIGLKKGKGNLWANPL